MTTIASLLWTISVLTTIMCHLGSTQALNILFKSGPGAPGSHFYTSSIIAETLVRRGHKVTFIISDAFSDRANSSLAKLFNFELYPSTVSRSHIMDIQAARGASSLKGERVFRWGKLKSWISQDQKAGGFKQRFQRLPRG